MSYNLKDVWHVQQGHKVDHVFTNTITLITKMHLHDLWLFWSKSVSQVKSESESEIVHEVFLYLRYFNSIERYVQGTL